MAPPPPLLLPVKHLLESDDAHRLGVRVLAQPGGRQPVRGLPGGPAQLGDARARAAPWPVLQPPPGRVVGERMRHKLSLLVISLASRDIAAERIWLGRESALISSVY